MSLRAIARKGDTSTHGGSITNTNSDETWNVVGSPVAVNGATLNCPIHGSRSITGNLSSKTNHNGKKIVLNGSTATCGAQIIAGQSSVKSE